MRSRAWNRESDFFTLCVDAMFTTSLEPPLTNIPDVTGAKSAIDCLCRSRHAG
jgi:hypothetical protein